MPMRTLSSGCAAPNSACVNITPSTKMKRSMAPGLAPIGKNETRFLRPSFRRTPGGGFTFEVQQVTGKDLRRSFVVKALSRSVIISTNQAEQALMGQGSQIRFPRQSSAHASDGIFNPALLPRGMRVAEKGAHR